MVQGQDTAVQSRGSAEVLGTSAKPTATIFPVALVTILFGAVPDMLKRPGVKKKYCHYICRVVVIIIINISDSFRVTNVRGSIMALIIILW